MDTESTAGLAAPFLRACPTGRGTVRPENVDIKIIDLRAADAQEEEVNGRRGSIGGENEEPK